MNRLERIKALEMALATSYRRIALPSDEPVQFVGVYVMHWGRADEPSTGFVEWTEEEIAALTGEA